MPILVHLTHIIASSSFPPYHMLLLRAPSDNSDANFCVPFFAQAHSEATKNAGTKFLLLLNKS